MHKRIKGYMTIEASFIMPMVFMLFLLIIMSAFFQFKRCVTSQNNYLTNFRASRRMIVNDDYGEVLYENVEVIKTVRRLKNGS